MRTPQNKGMKLTRPEHIGALQLIPGVRLAEERGWSCSTAYGRLALQSAALLWLGLPTEVGRVNGATDPTGEPVTTYAEQGLMRPRPVRP